MPWRGLATTAVVALVALAATEPAAARAQAPITLEELRPAEDVESCGIALFLAGAPTGQQTLVFAHDFLPGKDVGRVRVNGSLRVLRRTHVGAGGSETWSDRANEVIVRFHVTVPAGDTDGEGVAGTISVRIGHAHRTWRVEGGRGC